MDATAKVREEVIADIRNAFKGVHRNTGHTIEEAELMDGGKETAGQLAEARARAKDREWSEVPPHVIETHFTGLSFLDADGLRYYLPAFMIWSLQNLLSDSPTVDFTIYKLLYDYREVFTQEQCRAICRFLRFMADHSDGQADETAATDALAAFWGEFCTSA
jgi:hypothetical protein